MASPSSSAAQTEASRRYSVFGLAVQADRGIPGLRQTSAARRVDVRIETRVEPWPERQRDEELIHESPYLNREGNPQLRVWRAGSGAAYRFCYDDGAEFLVGRAGDRVAGRWPRALSIDDVGPYIVGPVLGFVLRLRGVVCLHASAVEIAGRAVAIVGPAGAGKSTTAAAFARRGRSVISDDVVALEDNGDGYTVYPAYPWLRLWSPSVEALFGSREALPRIAPNDPHWDKRFLDLSAGSYDFSARPVPLGALYLLAPRESAPPRLREERRSQLLMALVANTYVNYLLDRQQRGAEFDLLGRLVRRVPVGVVVPGGELDGLAELCDLIEGDFARQVRSGRGVADSFGL